MTKTKSDNWIMSFRLRNGFADDVIISGLDHKRIEDNLLNRDNRRDHLHPFILFNSGEWGYAMNFEHLTYCRFSPTSQVEEAESNEDDLYKARIYLATKKKPIELGLYPAPPREFDSDGLPKNNEIEDCFFYLLHWNREDEADKRMVMTDEDEDTAYFRIGDIAMLVVNRRCREADYAPA
jgi:hypothetical protein